MIVRGIGVIAITALAGCGSPWLGDESVNIAPVAVADAQLVPTTPEETVALAPEVPSTTSTVIQADRIEAVAPAGKGSSAVEPVVVADATLVPTPPEEISVVAPTEPNGSTGLVQVATLAAAPVPARPAGASQAANPVAFALATSHPVGQSVYPRDGGAVDALACGGYRSAVAAQEAFLAAGGPETDRLGLDPDGDGYACAWDPSPYREATGG